ncbi:twin-arginine translocation signal domain-containing protein [Streptomyces otsuchiensis]|uniref:twin-arginine translocation signal domain-containing protein n=1 Tax=Streptomyces otsuchiensis TaxID=2681388 RepID=UPI001300AB79|nr:twin-arginine translocation signal domain-containing protein [Streptomyces otsuchiensis]
MSGRTSRRGFLTAVAAAAGGAVALPVICASPALAADSGELAVVNRPNHPHAQYAPGTAQSEFTEPLNASVDCGLHGRAG